MFPYIMQGSNIVVVIDNQPHTVSDTHIAFEKIKEAIKAQDWETVRDLVDPKEVIVNYANGNVRIDGNKLYWREREFHNAMATRMISMLKEGFDVSPLANFMENVMQNPSYRSVEELYGFLEKCNLPITPDGCFLAYKKVRGDYKDCYTGTMDNSIGQVVEMPRNEVNDNSNETCSAGLHFCSQSYLDCFGGERTVILKINPRDVVSIPTDYNHSKGRCCRYEVVGELGVRPDEFEDRSVNYDYQDETVDSEDPDYDYRHRDYDWRPDDSY